MQLGPPVVVVLHVSCSIQHADFTAEATRCLKTLKSVPLLLQRYMQRRLVLDCMQQLRPADNQAYVHRCSACRTCQQSNGAR